MEGYAGNIATGLIAGVNASRFLKGLDPAIFPPTTLSGALCHYVTHASPADFQPMKVNFGILPPLDDREGRMGKRERATQRIYREKRKLITKNAHSHYHTLNNNETAITKKPRAQNNPDHFNSCNTSTTNIAENQ